MTSSPRLLRVRRYKPYGSFFYASGGMLCDALDVVYSCVCGVMGVSVKESVMHVGDEGGVHIIIKNNHNFGLRTLLLPYPNQIRRFSYFNPGPLLPCLLPEYYTLLSIKTIHR